jgi:4-carboxymuconolactone decarboxylase
MRLNQPRIQPTQDPVWDDETRKILQATDRGSGIFNIFRTLANHPKLLKRWLVFGNHILAKSTLPTRDRELLILRTGWLCGAEYEWGHHVDIGKEIGLSEAEIKRIVKGPDASGWDPFDATLLRAADELCADRFITDATWAALGERYDTDQLMDLVFTVGQYNIVSMALNSFGVQLEEGFEGFPR